jgi:hypothetical protein
MRVFNTDLNGQSLKGSPLTKVMKIIGLVLLGFVAVITLAAIFGLAVQWLWNTLMPVVFSLPEVSYWQAVGLVVLAQVFFGNHHSSHSGNNSNRHGKGEKHIHTDNAGQQHNYDSFGAFWKDYGRDAFNEWLNRNNENTEHKNT